MFMLLFFLLLGAYFVLRGGTEAGFWSGNSVLQGFLMLAAGVCLILGQLISHI